MQIHHGQEEGQEAAHGVLEAALVEEHRVPEEDLEEARAFPCCGQEEVPEEVRVFHCGQEEVPEEEHDDREEVQGAERVAGRGYLSSYVTRRDCSC